MIRIEIHTQEVQVIPTKRGQMRKQSGYAHTLDRNGKQHPHPVRCEFILRDEQQPYAPGNYTLAPQSFYTDKYGQLALSPVLQPVTR